MIHGTAPMIARGCDCNLCVLVRDTAAPRGPELGSVPAEPVRAHLDMLSDQGWTMTALADQLGYHRNTLYGIRGGHRVTVTPYVAEDILGFTEPAPAPLPVRHPCMHCDREARRRGLCHRHWREAQEGVIPMPTPTNRTQSSEGRELLAAANRRRVDEYIEQIDADIAAGVPVQEAVERLGWGVSAAARTLYRRGRNDLAAPLSRAVWRAKAAS